MYKISLSDVLSEDTIKTLLAEGYHKTICRKCGNQTFDHEFECPHCGDIYEGCVNIAKVSNNKIDLANVKKVYVSVMPKNDTNTN